MEDVTVDRRERRFVAHEGLVCRRIGGETILVPVSSQVGDLDAVYTLSDVGSTIWTLLRQPVSAGEIVEALCAEYDVTSAVASEDVAAFLNVLLSRKLVNAAAGEA